MAQEELLQAKGDPPEAKTENCCLIEPQPIREEQVQNALKFLSHPKVNGSPLEQRRSFLERKGLSREEIDEAFRRLPDPLSNESANNIVFSEGRYNVPLQQSQTQSGGFSQAVLTAHQHPAAQVLGPIPSAMSHTHTGSHWSQLVLGVGLLVATGAAAAVLFQRVFVPKLKMWIQDVVSEENSEQGKQMKLRPIEEAAGAAAAAADAAIAAAEVANKNREMFKSCTEEMHHLTSILKSLENQTQELKKTFPRRSSLSQDSNMQKQMVSKSNGCSPAGAGYNKEPIRSFRCTTIPLERIQSRQGIQSCRKTDETGQVQISNSMTKIEASNGLVGSSQNIMLTARSATEDWNQHNKSIVLEGNSAVITDCLLQTENVKIENGMTPGQSAGTSVQITEINAMSDGDSHSVQGSDSERGLASSNDLNSVGNQDWASPPSPRTVISGAAFAITHKKTVSNGDSKSLLVSEENDLASQLAATSIEDETSSTSTTEE